MTETETNHSESVTGVDVTGVGTVFEKPVRAFRPVSGVDGENFGSGLR